MRPSHQTNNKMTPRKNGKWGDFRGRISMSFANDFFLDTKSDGWERSERLFKRKGYKTGIDQWKGILDTNCFPNSSKILLFIINVRLEGTALHEIHLTARIKI